MSGAAPRGNMTYATALDPIVLSEGRRVSIYQIYYDQGSLSSLDAGFIPLDNSANARPDWYEFWVMLNFLRNNVLQEDVWYGFLSPKFTLKTGLPSHEVIGVLEQLDADYSAAIFSPSVDQLIFFDNLFAQGEYWHPGLIELTNAFLKVCKLDLDVRGMVSHSRNSGFANYIIAKAPFWRNWLLIADAFWTYVEHSDAPAVGQMKGITTYNERFGPMKTFMQERLMSIVLMLMDGKVYAPPLEVTLRNYDPDMREALISMDVLKRFHSQTGDPQFLKAFRAIRDGFSFDKQLIGIVRK